MNSSAYAEQSQTVRLFIDSIASHPRAIKPISLTEPNLSNQILVSCDWQVNMGSRDLKQGVSSLGVKDIEPVVWVIPKNFPINAPFPTLRKDFPREKLPHINPSLPEESVYPCITEESLLSFTFLHGIGALLHQLDEWLDKAATNDLMDLEQGWEPTRFTNIHGALTDILGEIVESAENHLRVNPSDAFVGTMQSSYKYRATNGPNPFITAEPDIRVGAEAPYPVPCYLLIIPENEKTQSFSNYPVSNRAELINFVAKFETGISTGDTASVQLLEITNHQDTLYKHILDKKDKLDKETQEQLKHPGFLCVLAIQRPTTLIGSSSKLEILPFYVMTTTQENQRSLVTPLQYTRNISPDLLQSISHEDQRHIKTIAFFGAGSVGSKVAMSLVRTGFYEPLIFDNGYIQPHHAARHGLSDIRYCLGRPKAEALALSLASLGTPFHWKYIDLTQQSPELPEDTQVIIESTGDESVSHMLRTSTNLTARIIQTGTYGKGTLGYLAIEPRSKEREVRCDDLEAAMYDRAIDSNSIQSGLFINGNAERQIVGHGCSSMTTILSDPELNLITAAITERIDLVLNQDDSEINRGTLSLCARDRESGSIKWSRWMLPPTLTLPLNNKADDMWSVRILGDAVEDIFNAQKMALPNETGGAIIGIMSEITQTIYVTRIVSPPDDAVTSSTEFTISVEYLKKVDQHARSSTQGKICLLGTWHSHTTPSSPSVLDRQTLRQLSHDMQIPIVTMLMCDGREIKVVV